MNFLIRSERAFSSAARVDSEMVPVEEVVVGEEGDGVGRGDDADIPMGSVGAGKG